MASPAATTTTLASKPEVRIRHDALPEMPLWGDRRRRRLGRFSRANLLLRSVAQRQVLLAMPAKLPLDISSAPPAARM